MNNICYRRFNSCNLEVHYIKLRLTIVDVLQEIYVLSDRLLDGRLRTTPTVVLRETSPKAADRTARVGQDIVPTIVPATPE